MLPNVTLTLTNVATGEVSNTVSNESGTYNVAAWALWRLPERAFQYVAIDLLGRHRTRLGAADIPELFRLAQEKCWWDSVDALAGVIGPVVRIH